MTNGIKDELVFIWWFLHVLNKRERILQKVKSKYWDMNHKCGIRVIKYIYKANRLDVEKGNTI